MNLDTAKNIIKKEIGVFHSFYYRGTRNQSESFKGVIFKVYPSIFVIHSDDGKVLSFSYNDFIVKNFLIIS